MLEVVHFFFLASLYVEDVMLKSFCLFVGCEYVK